MSGTPFLTRDPQPQEIERLRLALSSFQDGSGWERSPDGTTIAGWRQVERLVAEVLRGIHQEDKWIFDIVVRDWDDEACVYGVSVKSKRLTTKSLTQLNATGGRLYLEMSNSPARFWGALEAAGLPQEAWYQDGNAHQFGEEVLKTVRRWHQEDGKDETRIPNDATLDISHSIHLTLSSTDHENASEREYQWHAFSLEFPEGIEWHYRSAKSLKGLDPDGSGEVLVDWYPFSGGQLKYYPKMSEALYSSSPFKLEPLAQRMQVSERAARYWPDLWEQAGGAVDTET